MNMAVQPRDFKAYMKRRKTDRRMDNAKTKSLLLQAQGLFNKQEIRTKSMLFCEWSFLLAWYPFAILTWYPFSLRLHIAYV